MVSNNKIQSNYLYAARILNGNSEVLNTRITSWGILIENESENHYIKNTGNVEYYIMKSYLMTRQNNKLINEIIEYTNKHLAELKKYKIKGIYQIAIDFSKRVYTDDGINRQENKEIIIYTIKYYDDLGSILTDGYSNSFEQFDLNNIKRMLLSNLNKLSRIVSYKTINYIADYSYLCFSPFTAAVINHELFGHLFEKDNFEKFKADCRDISIPNGVTVYDSPNEKLSGYCTFDDYGNLLSDEKIIDKESISDLITDSNLTGIVRCRSGIGGALPRVTNTVIEAFNKININCLETKTIFIEGITRASLRKNEVLLYIDSSFMNIDGNICKLPSFKIELKVKNILEGIIGFWGNNSRYSTIDCIKNGQRCGGVGISSPGMLIKIYN